MNERIVLIILISLWPLYHMSAQTAKERYDAFLQNAVSEYSSFRNECNIGYIQFLRDAWNWYEGNVPLPLPKDKNPVPPRFFCGKDTIQSSIIPFVVAPVEETPQPKPIEPIPEKQVPVENRFFLEFFGNVCGIRMPEYARLKLQDCQNNSIINAWTQLCGDEMNNTIRDCLETRIRYQLCDWAYLLFLDKLGREYCADANGATLLTAFLFCQSGYQMRLGVDNENLVLLFGCKHQIIDKVYFKIDGTTFYPFGNSSRYMRICDGTYPGETPLSLFIQKEQKLGSDMTAERQIVSERYKDMSVCSKVPTKIIDFYNEYPISIIDGRLITKWALYANTPLSGRTKDILYPSLRKAILGLTELQGAEKLLNWVQTGFVYELDNKIWGYDRAFFAEESLFYPYCDCEDRSILFSRLVRDLLGLDVALIFYPGHLATAVCFNDYVDGDCMTIDGRRFVVCDPTYIGASVGAQMPDLEYDKAQAIVLQRQ